MSLKMKRTVKCFCLYLVSVCLKLFVYLCVIYVLEMTNSVASNGDLGVEEVTLSSLDSDDYDVCI